MSLPGLVVRNVSRLSDTPSSLVYTEKVIEMTLPVVCFVPS